MTTLHPRQNTLLRFLRWYVSEHPYPPTRREIATGTGIRSLSVVDYHLSQLAHKKLIRLDAETARGIAVVDGAA